LPTYSPKSSAGALDVSGNPADRYRIVGRIAAGGMAEIYLARTATNTGAEREVVLKRLLPELQADHEFVQMFHDEARIACQLNHPNIVQIYELGELDGSLFISPWSCCAA
jgi:serine/threonine protein kinase